MKDRKIFKALALVNQVGFNVFIPILAFVLLGMWIDKKLGGGGMGLLFCSLFGAAVGLSNIIRLGRKL